MLNSITRWIALCGTAAVLLVLIGCSSGSNNAYTLMAQLPPPSKQQLIMMAAIDVEGARCNVTVLTWSNNDPWTPSCAVNQDQPTHKNFTIDGQQVDLVKVGDSFKVSNAVSIMVPLPESATPAATTAAAAIKAKTGAESKSKDMIAASRKSSITKSNAATSAPASATAVATAAATPGQVFPTQWNITLFPGHKKLVAQNLGYLVKSAAIDIDGSACKLDVVFKVRYPPYHLACTATTNKRGDFTLLFSPFKVATAALSATNSILLVSEGESISGIIWDSHGFDSWTPSVPPSWRLRTKSDQ
ncbi:MAG TPA: hypothetical protein VNI53_05890 [Gammaproteobacteria bacterium]|nr:hypothetical protein [Gammaproteobacteria bacterium]